MAEIATRLGNLFLQSVPTIIFVFLLLILLERLLFRRLAEVLSEREARTTGALEKAREQAALAETRAREYEAAFQTVRQEFYRQREAERKKVLAEREAALHQARQESEARLAQARAELAADVEKTKMELQVTCQALAAQISNSLLGGAPAEGSRRAN